MDSSGPDMAVPARAEVYAVRHGLHIEERLGFGQDGTVRATSRATALKIHARRHTCHDERAAYRDWVSTAWSRSVATQCRR